MKTVSIHLAGEYLFLCTLIGSPIFEYPTLLTSEQNKMEEHFFK